MSNNYYILDQMSDADNVSSAPTEYYIMYLYIFNLKPKDEESSFLLLEYPSYNKVPSFDNEYVLNDCIWSTPYMAYMFTTNLKKITNIGKIKEEYARILRNKKTLLNELSRHRLYHLGLQDYNFEEGEHYIEYKESARHKGQWKCYYIQELYFNYVDQVGLLNLTDPEGLHKYRYLPIDNDEFKYNKDQDIIFDGKRLATNVANLLNSQKLKTLNQYYIEINASDLRYSRKGFIFKVDISGFSAMHDYIKNHAFSMTRSSNQIAEDFIGCLSIIFEKELRKRNIFEYRMEGDGFLASIPCNSDRNCDLSELFSLVNSIYFQVNSLLPKKTEELHFSIRCSIIFDRYLYGKVSSLFSLQQNHSGESIIRVTRLDEFLKAYIKKDLKPKADLYFGIEKTIPNYTFPDNYSFDKIQINEPYRTINIDADISKVFIK